MAWSLLKSCPLCGRGSGLGKETSLQNGERSSRQKAQKGCFLKQIAKRIQSGYARHQLPLQFPRAFAVPTYSLGAAANAISLSVRAHSPPDRRGRRIEKIGSLRLWPRPLRQPPRAFSVPTYSLGAAGGRYCFLSGARPTGQTGKEIGKMGSSQLRSRPLRPSLHMSSVPRTHFGRKQWPICFLSGYVARRAERRKAGTGKAGSCKAARRPKS